MAINRQKLQNVAMKPDGSITARCPACAASGADTKGEHLIVYPDDRYGCVANPEDKAHRTAIALLVGERGGTNGTRSIPKLEVRPQKIEASKRLLVLGQFGQKNPTPEANQSVQIDSSMPPLKPDAAEATEAQLTPAPSVPARVTSAGTLGNASMEEAKAFLLRKQTESPTNH